MWAWSWAAGDAAGNPEYVNQEALMIEPGSAEGTPDHRGQGRPCRSGVQTCPGPRPPGEGKGPRGAGVGRQGEVRSIPCNGELKVRCPARTRMPRLLRSHLDDSSGLPAGTRSLASRPILREVRAAVSFLSARQQPGNGGFDVLPLVGGAEPFPQLAAGDVPSHLVALPAAAPSEPCWGNTRSRRR